MSNANADIRKACVDGNVPFWRVAERYGIADTTLSRKMRRELPPKMKREMFKIIEELSVEIAEERRELDDG